MPIYEYRCENCHKVSSFLLLRVSEELVPYCKACGSKDVKKKISRVAVLRDEERIMESLLDPSKFSDLDENDPGSIERVMKRVGRELGDELGEDFNETLEEAMAGGASGEANTGEEI
ncbi:MAG: zinc ribbon domain-containing protein [Syntrophorhabdaceae bacterium]|nr:zinc ribbon domain-containing protein [Syntrophorhabdaceae bacterium]